MNTSVCTNRANEVGFFRIEVGNDSMSPTFQAGDVAGVEPCGFVGDGVYVVKISGRTQIKRLMWMPHGFLVISDNKLYPSYEADTETVIVLGRVAATIKIL